MIRTDFTAALFSALVLLLGGLGGVPAAGQELPWLKGGQVSVDLAPSFWAWDSRFGYRVGPSGRVIEETEPLAYALNSQALGSGPIPLLQGLEASLRNALQDESFSVRLGASHSIIEQSRLTFPIRLDVGVTDWLTLGAMVPFHRPRTEMDFFLDADSTSANVGLSPQLTAPSQVAGFVSEFQAALDAAQNVAPGSPALLEAQRFLSALGAAYSQSSVFPISGSQAGGALQGRLEEIRTSLESQGVTGLPQDIPLAETYLDREGFNEFLASNGMRAFPLEDWTDFWSIGDVEVTARFRLFRHGFEADSLGNLPDLRFQVGAGALLRLGTGTQADPNRFFDLDPADGQMDLEGSVFGLVEYGRRLGAWGRLRRGIQKEGTVVRRISSPEQVLPSVYSRAPLYWSPGNYVDLELNPRFYFTPEMTFGIRYHLWHKGQDAYTIQPIDPETQRALDLPHSSLLEMETRETLHEVAFTATYSTLAPNERGETPIPMMIRFAYFHPVAGSGGQTPKGGRLQVGLTLFRTFWGGDAEQGETTEGAAGGG